MYYKSKYLDKNVKKILENKDFFASFNTALHFKMVLALFAVVQYSINGGNSISDIFESEISDKLH